MPRKMMMTWDGRKDRWRKKSNKLAAKLGLPESHRFIVSCSQLVEQGLLDPSIAWTEQNTYRAANQWWEANLLKIGGILAKPQHPLQDQIASLELRKDYAKRHGLKEEAQKLSEEVELLESIDELELADIPMGVVVSQEALKNKKFVEDLFDWTIPPETPPMIIESFLGKEAVWVDRLSRESHTPVQKDKTIGTHVNIFLENEALKVKSGKLTPKTYDNLRYKFKMILDQLGSDKDISLINEQEVGKMKKYLYTQLALREEDPESKAGHSDEYLNAVGGLLRRFIISLHKLRLIGDLPRNLDELTINIQEKPKMKMTDQELIRIINGIPDENQLKLHVLLMLNCAYRGMDIATLKDSEIQDGRIIRKRHKTKDQKNTPVVNYKLWDETTRLLSKWKTQSGIALRTRTGGLWVFSKLIELEDGTHKTTQSDNIATNYKRVVVEGLGIDRPYSLIRKSAASKLDAHPEFGRYAVHFLGESPKSIASRHYITPDQDRFDAAVEWLGNEFGIK